MTRRRWLADEVAGDRAVLIGEHAEHLIRVLRARVGQEFEIVAGGIVRIGRVSSISDRRVDFELTEDVQSSAAIPQITLGLSIFKFDRMEWAIEKCTELGVARILPLIAQRTESHLASASGKRVERWRRIARQASEQSRRLAEPEIADPTNLSQFFNAAEGFKILLSEAEKELTLKAALQHSNLETRPEVSLAIGPEGGWTENELKQFTQNQWTSASLGATILRVETAAIAATAIVFAELS